MKRALIGLLLLAASPALAQQSAPNIAFESAPNQLRLPHNMYFGEASGVAVNSKGHVFVLSRGNTSGPAYAAAAAQLLEFDAKGNFIGEMGKNLYAWSFGHTVKADPQDNIWVTDKGSDMVIKFDPEGRVLMVFGRKQEASDEGTEPLKHPKPPLPAEDGRFRQVTDVAFDKAGNTFISDGYINSRIAKVDKDGNWLKSWGDRGKEPGQFNTPHSISIATDPNGNVYVADRGNHRIQVFDGDGKFLKQFVIDVPVPADAKPAIGRIPDEASPASSSNSSAGSTPWRARRKTPFTSPSC
jgi:DNA-binding beta-propeller fold protein YncE